MAQSQIRKNPERILIGHSFWGRGGAEAVSMHLLEALCLVYRVDLVTRGGFDLKELNRIAGTKVQGSELGAVRYAPFIPKHNRTGGGLWHALFLRFCRHIAPRYNLCITASRILDWGVPALHFLSDVTWNPPLQERFNAPEALSKKALVRPAYLAAARLLAGKSGRNPAQHDVCIANSKWTARVSLPFCGQPPLMIYPPVPPQNVWVSWEARQNDFLCFGRISPEKRIERVIAIVEEVRRMGHKVRLHIAGDGDSSSYLGHILKLCEERREWVLFQGPVYGRTKEILLNQCRYGISACDHEGFGIATAEMAGSGIVPFVPRSGGQGEIVREPELVYKNAREASLKIDAVLKAGARQICLQRMMMKRASTFRPERFHKQVRAVVRQVIDRFPPETYNPAKQW